MATILGRNWSRWLLRAPEKDREQVGSSSVGLSRPTGRNEARSFARRHRPALQDAAPYTVKDIWQLQQRRVFSTSIWSAASGRESNMVITSVDLDLKFLERARVLTGGRSNRAIFDLALRRLIATKQKSTMIEGIFASSDLESEIGSTVVAPPHTSP
ncbi:type II toxin-antitoxin system VapB family antitoxin [Paeniglutamicibacter gangotriensis]|nr:type II toxin-antitoxin system VapB family antitoxin [Paeniglutamicibacter gangotriensis]